MNGWTHIKTRNEIEAFHALTGKLDPAFAARERTFYESRTVQQLRILMIQASNCSDETAYQMAHSYLNLKETQREAA